MKKIFAGRYTLLALLSIGIFTGCSSEEPAVPGPVKIEFSHTFGDQVFTLNNTYTTSHNEDLTFTMAKYYISNIRLKNADGSEWEHPESYFLVDLENPSSSVLTLDSVPPGEYTEITYLVGVDSTRNTSGAQTGALSPSNDMFWSWNSGYIFVRLEGTSPQSTSGSFAFHAGGFKSPNIAMKTITHSFGSHPLKITGTGIPELHVTVDFQHIFNATGGLEVSQTNMLHMPGATAVSLVQNFATGFMVEELHL